MPGTTQQIPSPEAEAPMDAVRALANELLRLVSAARALVEAGSEIDLANFDNEVGLLCARILDLPPDEGRLLRPRLIALSGSVEGLSRALVARTTLPR
jgi:hypothetical protein